MIRLQNKHGFDFCEYNYALIDTVTKDFIGRCLVRKGKHNGVDVWALWNFRIFDEFQRKGYATLMLKRIINKYKNQTEPLVLFVHKENEIAIRLYEKLGFKIIEDKELILTMQYSK